MTDTSAQAVLELGSEFKGEAIHPGDPEFDRARAVYNGSIDRRPALIVRPTGAADVMDAVNYARTAQLPIVVRGGHSVAGTSSCEGGVLVDLSSLKGVNVDLARGTALTQAGVLWGEYDRETQLYGTATPGGRVTTTGVGGFTLGGGYGWLSRKYGLTCDNLVAADIVTADGRLVHVSESENPELLWGLRGGRELRGRDVVRAAAAPPCRCCSRGCWWSRTRTPGPCCAPTATTLTAPEEVVSDGHVPGAWRTSSRRSWSASRSSRSSWRTSAVPTRPSRRWHRSGRSSATRAGWTSSNPMPYTALQAMLDGFAPKGWLNYHRGQHLSALSDEIIEPFLAVGQSIHSPMTQGIIFHHGGAVSRVPEDATAAGNRAAEYTRSPAGRHRTRPTTRWTGYGGSPRRSRPRPPEAPT